MDWVQQHWPWLSAIFALMVKAIRDHLMIADHEERIEHVENVQANQSETLARISANIEHLVSTTDKIAEEQGITKEDIKDILRNK